MNRNPFKGKMPTFLPMLEPDDYLVVDALSEKYGGTWKFNILQRMWLSQREEDTIWIAKLVNWKPISDGRMPDRVYVLLEVGTNRIGTVQVCYAPIGMLDIGTRLGTRMYNELHYANFGEYPEQESER